MVKSIFKGFGNVLLLLLVLLVMGRVKAFAKLEYYPVTTVHDAFVDSRGQFLLATVVMALVAAGIVYFMKRSTRQSWWIVVIGVLWTLVLLAAVDGVVAGLMSALFYFTPNQIWGSGGFYRNYLLILPGFVYPVAYGVVAIIVKKSWARPVVLLYLVLSMLSAMTYAINPLILETIDELKVELCDFAKDTVVKMVTPKAKATPQRKAERFEDFKVLAERGNADAQYALFKCYFEGIGTARDYDQAHVWATKAWDNGNPLGSIGLGDLYMTQAWSKYDPEKAITYYKKVKHFWGEEVRKCVDERLKAIYSAQAEAYLANPAERESPKAIETYKSAAQYEHLPSAYAVGMYYVKKEDLNNAGQYFLIIVDCGSLETYDKYAESEYYVGKYYEYYGWAARTKAPEFYERAAEHGYLPAQKLLVERYRYGDDLFLRDSERAAIWAQRAAETEATRAQ